jgi:hypothetical protein
MPNPLTKLFPSGEPEEVQARRRRRFVWTTGVLGWGGFMFLFGTLDDWYRAGYIRIPPLRPFLSSTIPNLIIWPIAGYFFGAMLWRRRRDSDL